VQSGQKLTKQSLQRTILFSSFPPDWNLGISSVSFKPHDGRIYHNLIKILFQDSRGGGDKEMGGDISKMRNRKN
jgi:hypothetical protein